ncbi:hypothetical protein C8R45DRAFT_930009 [Mycena sanguinolenta]|nr:hypothetical protein C8R45DRAFT_930009 [Mycena sanguinolenta]
MHITKLKMRPPPPASPPRTVSSRIPTTPGTRSPTRSWPTSSTPQTSNTMIRLGVFFPHVKGNTLSLALTYPTLVSVSHLLVNAYKNLLTVSLATEYAFEGSEKVKEYLANPDAFAVAEVAPAASAAPAAEKAEEPAEESDEDMISGRMWFFVCSIETRPLRSTRQTTDDYVVRPSNYRGLRKGPGNYSLLRNQLLLMAQIQPEQIRHRNAVLVHSFSTDHLQAVSWAGFQLVHLTPYGVTVHNSSCDHRGFRTNSISKPAILKLLKTDISWQYSAVLSFQTQLGIFPVIEFERRYFLAVHEIFTDSGSHPSRVEAVWYEPHAALASEIMDSTRAALNMDASSHVGGIWRAAPVSSLPFGVYISCDWDWDP